ATIGSHAPPGRVEARRRLAVGSDPPDGRGRFGRRRDSEPARGARRAEVGGPPRRPAPGAPRAADAPPSGTFPRCAGLDGVGHGFVGLAQAPETSPFLV